MGRSYREQVKEYYDIFIDNFSDSYARDSYYDNDGEFMEDDFNARKDEFKSLFDQVTTDEQLEHIEITLDNVDSFETPSFDDVVGLFTVMQADGIDVYGNDIVGDDLRGFNTARLDYFMFTDKLSPGVDITGGQPLTKDYIKDELFGEGVVRDAYVKLYGNSLDSFAEESSYISVSDLDSFIEEYSDKYDDKNKLITTWDDLHRLYDYYVDTDYVFNNVQSNRFDEMSRDKLAEEVGCIIIYLETMNVPYDEMKGACKYGELFDEVYKSEFCAYEVPGQVKEFCAMRDNGERSVHGIINVDSSNMWRDMSDSDKDRLTREVLSDIKDKFRDNSGIVEMADIVMNYLDNGRVSDTEKYGLSVLSVKNDTASEVHSELNCSVLLHKFLDKVRDDLGAMKDDTLDDTLKKFGDLG